MKNKIKIGFIGLTHLGLNYLAATAQKKFSVIGVDISKSKIEKLKQNNIEYKEPYLKNTILKNKKRILFSNNLKDLKKCNLVFVSQDVKTNAKGKSNVASLKFLIKKTIKNLNKKSVLIIISQIKPGFMRSINIDKKRLYHQVETLVFGNAIKRALHPERFIVGCQNKYNQINKAYLSYLKSFHCPIIKMNYESAEIAKISINVLLASSVTATNVLSELCEKNSADWTDIIPALKLDKRIGKFSYIKPGLGIAGGNIERDIVTTKDIFKKKTPPNLILGSILENSKYMKNWTIRLLSKNNFLKKKRNIGIVGATYKENTNSIKNSPTITLIKNLNKKHKIEIYEPMLNLNIHNNKVIQIQSLSELIKQNEVIIFMRPWNLKKEIKNIYKYLRNKIILDPYRVIDFINRANKTNSYFTLGKG